MSFRLAGSARVAIAAVSIMVGAAACGSDAPGAEPTDSVTVPDTVPDNGPADTLLSDRGSPDTVVPGGASSTNAPPGTSPTSAGPTTTPGTSSDPTVPRTAATVIVDLGVSEAEVAELEQQLDEIDRVLADLEAQLSED